MLNDLAWYSPIIFIITMWVTVIGGLLVGAWKVSSKRKLSAGSRIRERMLLNRNPDPEYPSAAPISSFYSKTGGAR